MRCLGTAFPSDGWASGSFRWRCAGCWGSSRKSVLCARRAQERGVRDRLNALTRKTHAFAKQTRTWDALVMLCLFEPNGIHPHQAVQERAEGWPGGRRDRPRTLAMAIGLTDHIGGWEEFLDMINTQWSDHPSCVVFPYKSKLKGPGSRAICASCRAPELSPFLYPFFSQVLTNSF